MFKENDVVKWNDGNRGRPTKFTVLSVTDGIAVVKDKHGEEYAVSVDMLDPYPEKKQVVDVLRGPDSE